MHPTRRLLQIASLCSTFSLAGVVHAQTITYTNGDTNTDSLVGGTYQLVVASGTATHGGVISGAARIDKQGAGTLILSGSNTYDEGTTVTAGTLIGTNASAFGDVIGTITLAGGTLQMTGGSYTVANPMNVTGAATVGGTFSGGDVTTYTGAIQLSGGTLTLNAANTNRIDVTSAITGTGNIVIAGNYSGVPSTTSRVILSSDSTPNFTGNLTINSGGVLQLTNDLTTNTVTNNGSLWLASSTGDSSTLTLGGLAGSGVVRVIMNGGQTATLNVGGNNESTTFSGIIAQDFGGSTASGSIALAKTGTGTFTLTGANIYQGITTVSAGTLLANNTTGSATSTGNVTVNSGATLGGTGFISGLTTVASGGHVAPGAAVGTLTFNAGLTLQTGSILDFQLGTSSDQIVLAGGALTGPGTVGGVTLNLSNSGGFTAGTYTLINYTSALASSGYDADSFTLGSTISGYTYNLALSGNSLQLTATASAIPEPSTYAALAGVAALGLALLRKRRRLAHTW